MSKFTAAHVRRASLAAAPVLGGLACVVASIADPEPTATGLRLVEIYTDHWDAVQLKSSAYHYGYMLIAATSLGLAALVRRGRGVGLALVAGALAILGISTLPGMLIVDFYASAGGQQIGPEAMRELEVASQGGWGATAIVAPGMLGFLLSLPLAAIAAVRAGLLRWWAPLVIVAALASFSIFMAQPQGTALMTAFFAVLGVAIMRIPVAAFGGREPHVDAAASTSDVASTTRAEAPVAVA